MNIFKKNFLSEEAEVNLPNYKYKGSDNSYLYKYIFSPIAQSLVDKVLPTWLAPNVITLLGFCCTLVPHMLILFNNPFQLEGEVPAWMCFLAAVGQITYMILDNADGKQARKTGSSSPLGLLFDHGCDAMNTFVTGLNIFAIAQLGNSMYSLIGYIIAFVIYYLFNWEQYYVESLDLPWFNGPNEGLVGIAGLFVVSGIFGTQMWFRQVHGVYGYQLVVIIFSALAVPTVISNFWTVYKKVTHRFCSTLPYLIVVLYLVATMLIAYYLSVTDVVSTTCRYLIYFIGFSHAKLVGILQACHCSHVEFNQWRLSILIPATLFNINIIIGSILGHEFINEEIFVYAIAGFSFLAYMHFVLNIISQMTRVLNIRVFKITNNKETLPEVNN
jgi:ethanolaminephosphotransferase